MTRNANQFKLIGVFLILLLASSCATTPKQNRGNLLTPVPSPLTAESRETYLDRLNYWSLRGRIGIVTPDESNSANIFWEKHHQQLKLRIYDSLGITYALLTSEPGSAKIELTDDQVFYGDNAQELLWRTTGWQIPVDAIQHWILGSVKDAPSFSLNDQQFPKAIQFADWHMMFKTYKDFSGLPMPRKIRIEHPELTLKFSIRDWQFAKPEA